MMNSIHHTDQVSPVPKHASLFHRHPGLLMLGCLLLLTWGAAAWLSRHTWQEKDATALRVVNDQAREASETIERLLAEADQALLALRTSQPLPGAKPDPEHWNRVHYAGGLALLAPDGQVLAASPNAVTTGWAQLMTRLTGAEDTLLLGAPVPAADGRSFVVPAARRIPRPDGMFGGLVMTMLDGEALTRLSPAMESLEGSMTLLTGDGIVLSRSPMLGGPVLGGIVGVRVANAALFEAARHAETGAGRDFGVLDGDNRIYAYRRPRGTSLILLAGIGHEAAFAGWKDLQLKAIATAATATVLIAMTVWLSYRRRQRADISSEALRVVLDNIEQGVRVEGASGSLFAVNEAGVTLRAPSPIASPDTPAEPPPARERLANPAVSRHDLPSGGKVLIGADGARRMADARIEFLTCHDTLTGLPNRWHATALLESLVAERAAPAAVAGLIPPAGVMGAMAALILFDIDGFQDINDTLGHEAGDAVLSEVAARLRTSVADSDMVARLGGDEFLLFLREPADETSVLLLADEITRMLSRPIGVRGQQVRLGASMGIALCPRDGADAATLFRHANIALSDAKQAGRGTARGFEPAMMAAFEEHRMMESDLRRALDTGELEIHLQPQFSCETLDVTGFEALTRWRHPTRGNVSPAVFIPIAERSGLINPLGLWALEQACKEAAAWRTRHRVAVNLSPVQLRGEMLEGEIRDILDRTQFPAHLLELEVTESVLLDKDERTLSMLHRLRAMDIRITLDDFGAGYSSLSYLRRFPFDKVKIDRCFIEDKERATRVILESMIRMCGDLGFDVVAEGVETDQQLEELRALRCQEVQGFLLGRPMPPGEIEAFLATHARRAGVGVGGRSPGVVMAASV